MLATETDLVIAARSGDRAAIRRIHDTYCGPLYDHCSAVLRDPETAGNVMLETFMLAFVELHRLEDPEKLQPWLFALARDQMLYRPRSPLLPPDRDDRFDPVPVRARAIAWEATAWFPRRERIVLDLHLRQHFARQNLADAIGASIAHAGALTSALEVKLDRLVGALLVARLAADCPELATAAEHAFDPRVTMRRFAHHVDRCRRCSDARLELPSATELIASIPADSEPPELRGEALERVHLVLLALESSDATLPGDAPIENLALIADPVDELDEREAFEEPDHVDDLDLDPDDEPYEAEDDYDIVQELTPPPVPLRHNGFPKALFHERRRLVTLIAAAAVGIVALALVFDARGASSGNTRLLAAGATESTVTVSTTPPTVPPSTAVPVSSTPADTVAPTVANLATTYACIGLKQPRTDALATVSDDHVVRSVDLVVTHDVLGSTRKRMIASGGQYRAEIGPYTDDGTITWTVEAIDEAGNIGTATGPPVGSSSAC